MPSDCAQIDHFAKLGTARRPWLDPEALQERFHELAARHHPDAGGTSEAFAAANAAYAVLRNPGARLRHLLELEVPALLEQASPIPEAVSARFLEIATLRREVDAFLHQQAAATTPLARALLASARAIQRHDVERVLADLESMRERCFEAVRAEDALWDGHAAEAAPRLAVFQQELAYLEKWISQLRELLLQLGDGG